jgi:hypothetical protein
VLSCVWSVLVAAPVLIDAAEVTTACCAVVYLCARARLWWVECVLGTLLAGCTVVHDAIRGLHLDSLVKNGWHMMNAGWEGVRGVYNIKLS